MSQQADSPSRGLAEGGRRRLGRAVGALVKLVGADPSGQLGGFVLFGVLALLAFCIRLVFY